MDTDQLLTELSKVCVLIYRNKIIYFIKYSNCTPYKTKFNLSDLNSLFLKNSESFNISEICLQLNTLNLSHS